MRKRGLTIVSEMRSFCDNNEMHAKPDLRAVKIDEINRSGSVISAVIHLGARNGHRHPELGNANRAFLLDSDS
jgi:hypothetical protein